MQLMVFKFLRTGMFHNLLFLGSGGRTVFQGGVEEAAKYFRDLGIIKPENVNPADFYMDVIGGQYSQEDGSKYELFGKYETYRYERDGSSRSDTNSDQPTKKEGDGRITPEITQEAIELSIQKPGATQSQGL